MLTVGKRRVPQKNITRPELVNKILLSIDTLIEQANATNDPTQMAGLADKLAKFSAVIEKLDKKANIIDAIDVFKAFSGWLEFRGANRPVNYFGTYPKSQPTSGYVHH